MGVWTMGGWRRGYCVGGWGEYCVGVSSDGLL